MAREPDGTSQLHLRTLFGVGVTAGLTDGQLLERFATHRGEAAELAFAALVERHGPMVFRACRGILGDDHEAQDAFQATFLVLLRKGGTLWVGDSLGPWLHRVACRAAGRARVDSDRRRAHERRAAEGGGRKGGGSLGDLGVALHEEVDRLPERYRVPVVLCDLEGRTYEEAARHLGCPVGTVRSRLSRGRERLRGRLTRRGLAPSAAVLGVGLSAEAAMAAMPVTSVGPAIRAAMCILAGDAATAGDVPAPVIELTEGVMKMMFMNKVRLIAMGLLAAVGLVIGAGALAQQAAQDRRPGALPPQAGEHARPEPLRVAEGDRRWVRTLTNGASIEVIGVSLHPSGPGTWWGPDGAPLAQAPCDPARTRISSDRDVVFRAIVARVKGVPHDADSGWSTREGGGGSQGRAFREGEEVPDLEVGVTEFPSRLATCTVQFEVATGQWQTVGTSDGSDRVSQASRNGPSFIFAEAIATRAGTVLTVTHDLQEVSVRLVAVDRDGEVHPALRDSGGGTVKGFTQLGAEFDLGPEAIREYRLQTRPYERVEIKGIALKPAGAE